MLPMKIIYTDIYKWLDVEELCQVVMISTSTSVGSMNKGWVDWWYGWTFDGDFCMSECVHIIPICDVCIGQVCIDP